jgi:hypothetical protein
MYMIPTQAQSCAHSCTASTAEGESYLSALYGERLMRSSLCVRLQWVVILPLVASTLGGVVLCMCSLLL